MNRRQSTITLEQPNNVQILATLMNQILHDKSCLFVVDSKFWASRTQKMINDTLNTIVEYNCQPNTFEKKVFIDENNEVFIRYRYKQHHSALLKVVNSSECEHAPFIYNTIVIIKSTEKE